MVEIL
jgi:hypothetical protein